MVGIHQLFSHGDALSFACYLPATPGVKIDWLRIRPRLLPHLVEQHYVDTLHCVTKIGPLLGHRLGRRPNTTAALGECLVRDPHILAQLLNSTLPSASMPPSPPLLLCATRCAT